MKKLLTASLLTLSLATASHADSFLDYFGLGLALQDVSSPNFDNGTAIVINGGKSLYQGIGLEFEGTASIQKMEGSFNGLKDDVDFWSVGMYSTYIWKLGNLSIKPRIGLIYDSIKSDIDINSPKVAVPGTLYEGTDKSGLGLSAGIGLAYQLSESYNVYTNYTRMEDDIDHLTFGAEFKF
jgi:outer membrane receptor protein involved in Fe transport